jgi:hypothetical protein
MHGLNTIQSASFGPTYNITTGSGAPTRKVLAYYTVDTPANLAGGLFNGEIATSTREYWVKRYYNIYYFTNTLSIPCMMTVQKFLCRQAIPHNTTNTDVETAMDLILDETNPAQLRYSPFLSNLTSPQLHKYFKIIYNKTWVMTPGKMYKIKQAMRKSMLNRPLQRAVEGNSTDYLVMKGSVVMLVSFNGVPCFNHNLSDPETTLGPVRVVTVNKFYGSYYNMDDTSDTNEVYGYLPTSQSSALLNALPSQYTMQQTPVANQLDPVTVVGMPSTYLGDTYWIGATSGNALHTQP